MKKTFKTLAIFGCILSYSISKSQVSAYGFTQSIKPYGAVNTGTLLGTNTQDDTTTVVNLPFNFAFNGFVYSSVNVSSNGYISFSTPSNTLISPISDPGSQAIASAFGSDILMGTYTTANLTAGSNTLTNVMNTNNLSVGDSLLDYSGDFASGTVSITAIVGNSVVLSSNSVNSNPNYLAVFYTGSIRQTNSGVAPNRICEFEFRNFTRNSAVNEGFSFKILLYETSNKIEFLYGAMNVGNNITQPLEVGLKGNSNIDFNIRKVDLTNSWTSSAMGTSITDDCQLLPSLFPALGLSYEWAPTCSVPQLSVTQSNSVICSGKSATLNALGASSYSWVGQSTSAQIIVSPTINTTYTLIAFSGTCSAIMLVTQVVQPTVALAINATSTLICTGNTSTLSASGATSYSWSNGSALPIVIINPTVTTTYTVSTPNNNCAVSASISIKVNKCTSILNNLAYENNFSVYPSPFDEELNFKNNSNSKMSVRVLNLAGIEVVQFECAENEEAKFNVLNLTSGIYFLQVSSREFNFTKKIIKQ